MKAELFQAFYNDLSIVEVPIGLSVSTSFHRDDGDRVGFFVVKAMDGSLHLEDDGATIPLLAEAGVDFNTETRRRAMEALLQRANARFDPEQATIVTDTFDAAELSVRALDFVAMLIRMNDFLLLTQERVASTFREDAGRRIKDAMNGRAVIRENEPVSLRLSEVAPDMVIETRSRPPVAVFFGMSPARVNDALFLHFAALHEAKEEVSIIALLEEDNSVPAELRRRATNRLATVPVFRNDEDAAVARVLREALGQIA